MSQQIDNDQLRSKVFRMVHDYQKGYRSGSLVDAIMETIEQERRAAAEAMRERCADFIENQTKPNPYEMADQIRELPLDSDGGA